MIKLNRPSHMAVLMLGTGAIALAAMIVHARFSHNITQVAAHASIVKELGLTDLALFTEARYTRHPSQADLHTPFQDHPLSFDHFPSGSLVPPQRHFGGKNLFAPNGAKRP